MRKKWDAPSVLAVVFGACAVLCWIFFLCAPEKDNVLLRMGLMYSITVFLLLPKALGRKEQKENPSQDIDGKKDKKV